MPLCTAEWHFFGDCMREIEFLVPEQYNGVTLRGFLRGFVGLSARQTSKLKRLPKGIVRNGCPVIAPDLLRAGDSIVLTFPDDDKIPSPAPLPVAVIYEDEDLLIVDKPPHMPMYPCPGHDSDSLANAAAFVQISSGEHFAFRPVYRLDKDTTGLVLLAKNPFAASHLAGTVKKTYLAVCEGCLAGSGLIDRPIGLKPGHSIQRAVMPGGQRAVTQWRSVAAGRMCSLIAIHLQTGRTHQIRVHFSAAGHPLAGDDMYGGSLEFIGRQALHCAKIRFRHPISGKIVRFSSPLPEDMLSLLRSNRNFNE